MLATCIIPTNLAYVGLQHRALSRDSPIWYHFVTFHLSRSIEWSSKFYLSLILQSYELINHPQIFLLLTLAAATLTFFREDDDLLPLLDPLVRELLYFLLRFLSSLGPSTTSLSLDFLLADLDSDSLLGF